MLILLLSRHLDSGAILLIICAYNLNNLDMSKSIPSIHSAAI